MRIIHFEKREHYQSEEKMGICVVRRKGESTIDLIRRFRKKFSKSGISKEYRDAMYYEKPSIKKRKKRARAIRMLKKDEEKKKEMQERSRKYNIRRRKQNARSSQR